MIGAMFTNPVHQAPFADPFVLEHAGGYYAYGTPPEPGFVPVLVSDDLVTWHPAGDALRVAADADRFHWAPEVAWDGERFWMYYSCGGPDGAGHQLRAACASTPTGPFEPVDGVLTPDEPFSIDAHPFRASDGSWYLFYCRDFVEGDGFVGTGIVVDRLEAMDRLAGDARTVVRPHEPWHIFERDRDWSGRIGDWYTIEGPSVIERDGRFWCLFSGGAWQEANYGVSSAWADHPLGPYTAVRTDDGADILRSFPGAVGPGHASTVLAPDGRTRYLVYHAWDEARTGRRMYLDRLMWSDSQPAKSGPTCEPQPSPP
ncbi:MAG: hypothetical protein JWN41_1220 [Thermoleophilia bacterium]|nr:hypothetical protein [Thermoleophilia bacterium]